MSEPEYIADRRAMEAVMKKKPKVVQWGEQLTLRFLKFVALNRRECVPKGTPSNFVYNLRSNNKLNEFIAEIAKDPTGE